MANKEQAELPECTLWRNMWIFDDGTEFHTVMGGAGDDDDDNDDDDDTDDKSKKPETFTQHDLNRVGAREKREGKRIGREELLSEIGTESAEEAKKLINTARASDGKANEEVTRLQGELESANGKVKKLEQNLVDLQQEDKIFAALVEAGLEPKAAKRSVRLVKVDADADEGEIAAEVDSLLVEMPQLRPSRTDDGNDDDDEGKSRSGDEDKPDERRERGSVGPPPRKKGKQEPDAASQAKSVLDRKFPNRGTQTKENA